MFTIDTSSRFMNAASKRITSVSHRRGSAVLAWGDDPPVLSAVLAWGDDPPVPPAVLAWGDDPPVPPAFSRGDADGVRICASDVCASDVMSVSDLGRCCQHIAK